MTDKQVKAVYDAVVDYNDALGEMNIFNCNDEIDFERIEIPDYIQNRFKTFKTAMKNLNEAMHGLDAEELVHRLEVLSWRIELRRFNDPTGYNHGNWMYTKLVESQKGLKKYLRTRDINRKEKELEELRKQDE